jgi:phosphoglycolate phosphatase
MNLFFDLDGTLLDAKLRVYTLFCALSQQKELDFEAYWELKKRKISHSELLASRWGFSSAAIHEFQHAFLQHIESPQYLDIDTPIAGVEPFLHHLKAQGHRLFIVTARQTRASVNYQIDRWKWTSLFDQVLVTEHQHTKEDLMRPWITHPSDAIMLGDTCKDVQAGKALHIPTVAVLSGFLSRASLEAYQPDYILDSVCDLPQTQLLSFHA